MMKIAVLVSGNGSNLQALIDAQCMQHWSGEIVGVISNKADAYALERAKQANIETQVIEHKAYPHREMFDDAMHHQLIQWGVDLVILAGFMRILSEKFVKAWEGKMINIHPSLLPLYKGMHTHQRVLNTGDVFHGCTVHYVTAELDAGPALLQGVVKVAQNDNVNTLAKRVHELEHLIYPQVVEWICNQTIQYQSGQALFKGKPISKPLQLCQM